MSWDEAEQVAKAIRSSFGFSSYALRFMHRRLRQVISNMDRETELRRRINYVSDLIDKSDLVLTGDSPLDYYDYYRSHREVIEYLIRWDRDTEGQTPELIKPNIFNKKLGGFWTITVLGLLNPFFAILIFTLTFPVSIPYLLIRAIILRRTKNRIEEAKVFLVQSVNRLKEQRVAMTSR